MKKFLGLLLCAAILLSITACGGTDTPAPTAAPTETAVPATEATVSPEEPTAEPTAEPTMPHPTMENVVLVDNDDVTFAVVKAENNAHLGMQLHVQCVNKTDRTLMFSWDMVSICGYMYDPLWATEVAAGKSALSTVDLDTYVLGKMGIDSVDELTFTLRIYDSENWMDEPLVEDIFTIYPTGLNAETFALPDHVFSESHVVVADDENVRFVIEGVTGNPASDCEVHVFLENKTDRNLLFAWDLVSVNGHMIDPFWGSSVGSGKRACCTITFSGSDLEQNGITAVSELEFTLTVTDYDSWEAGTLLDSTFIYNP